MSDNNNNETPSLHKLLSLCPPGVEPLARTALTEMQAKDGYVPPSSPEDAFIDGFKLADVLKGINQVYLIDLVTRLSDDTRTPEQRQADSFEVQQNLGIGMKHKGEK